MHIKSFHLTEHEFPKARTVTFVTQELAKFSKVNNGLSLSRSGQLYHTPVLTDPKSPKLWTTGIWGLFVWTASTEIPITDLSFPNSVLSPQETLFLNAHNTVLLNSLLAWEQSWWEHPQRDLFCPTGNPCKLGMGICLIFERLVLPILS